MHRAGQRGLERDMGERRGMNEREGGKNKPNKALNVSATCLDRAYLWPRFQPYRLSVINLEGNFQSGRA